MALISTTLPAVRRLTLPAVLSTLAALAGVSACSSSAPPSALQGKSASQVMTAALAAAKQAGSMHLTVALSGPNGTQALSGDLSGTDGQLDFAGPAQFLHLKIVGGTGYLNADAGTLQKDLGIKSATTAAADAGKWVSLKATDGPYAQLAQTLSFTAAVAQFLPNPSGMTILGTKTVGGKSVLQLKGPLNQTGYTGSTIFTVSATSPTTPVSNNATAAKSGKTSTQTTTFSAWGVPVKLTAPTGAIAFSTIPLT